jgi:hypothetical protein
MARIRAVKGRHHHCRHHRRRRRCSRYKKSLRGLADEMELPELG